MKKFKKYALRFFLLLLFILISWCLFNRQLVSYGVDQLRGQLNIVWNARPVEEVLNDKSFPDSIHQKLLLVEEIKQFAIDSLGLKASKNYTTLFDQKRKPLLWVVTGSEQFAIKPYLWKFPLLGEVSYKGFFDYEKGRREDSLLKLKGYDTDFGEVSAWSTLGWFRDPILSNMLFRTEGQLAELIIHEMTHATIYIKSNVDFNENLASVVGEQGAIRFLKSKYADSSIQFLDYINRKNDYDLFSKHMLHGTTLLDSLYNSFEALSVADKMQKKDSLINVIIQSLDTVSFRSSKRYSDLFKKRKPNNAYFMDFRRYDAQKDDMKRELETKFDSDIKKYLQNFEMKN